ncbi:hypothetical protein RFI_21766 [Reticulomyxa filosa]|uniref:Peptidase C14 caspase domain-containing protein n=1 Tax=Reticulomyxa filosa TaxID=46433 RepID=X6MP09_RETFI|nr:hypothetical protein RFI_21766 [Reticulomyxa filosa]|eukprot:ETO15599.1 hypothetical protein RFI_21766 [Reticulomyxa filosa]
MSFDTTDSGIFLLLNLINHNFIDFQSIVLQEMEAYVNDGLKVHTITLSELTLERLQQQILQFTQPTHINDLLMTITDKDGTLIETDTNVVYAFEKDPVIFTVQFGAKDISKKDQTVECKNGAIPSYKVKHPLVLLTGTIKYEQGQYLEDVKRDLYLLRTLFRSKLGYQVFTTYSPQHPKTESLTLCDLENFIKKHRLDLTSTLNESHPYDGLIFVWCGRGEDGYTLITSDNKIKDLKEIENDFKTDYFVGKPKIFVIITFSVRTLNPIKINQNDESIQEIAPHNHDADISIFVNTAGKYINNSSGSYFTEILCQVIENNMEKSLECIIKMVFHQIFEKENVQLISGPPSEIYLTMRSQKQQSKNDNDDHVEYGQKRKREDIPETLSFKKYWNRYWRKANAEAAKTVEQMMNDDERGLVIVAQKISEWKIEKDSSSCASSFITLINNGNIIKKQFDQYWMYVIKTKLIILDNVNIDGNMYVINCELQCKENVNITVQVFVTKNAIVQQHTRQFFSPILWNTKIHHDISLQLQDLENKGDECSSNKRFNDSIIYLQNYLQICVDTFGFDHPFVAVSYNIIGITYDDSEQHDKAIQLFEKALKIILNIFGSNCIFVAQLYHNIGDTYYNKKQYDKSIEYYEKALKIRLDIFGDNHEDVAWSYNNLGNAYQNKKQYDKAMEFYESALKIRINVFGVNHEDVASSYYCVGFLNEQRGQNNEAVEFYEKCLKIRLEIFGNNHSSVADSYYALGNTYRNAKQYSKAIEFYEKTLKIRLDIFGMNHCDVANSYNNLGISYNRKGEYDKSIECHEKALKIRLNIYGPNHIDVASSYNNLGVAYNNNEYYHKAIEYHENALKIRRQISGYGSKDSGMSCWNLGNIFEKIEDKETARRYFEEAWRAISIFGGEWDAETVQAKKKVENLDK